MLESIRSGARSFGVKIAFGIIILVFVFWGVGNFNDRDYSNVVAVVNGEPIVALQFEKAYHNAEEYLLRNNPGLTRQQLAKEHLGRQVLNDLVRATLIAQEARRAGISVSPQEMRMAVGKIKAFQDDNGRFNPEAYKRVLAARRTTPAEYEKELGDELLAEKMFSFVTSPVWIDPDEALNRFNFLRERRIIDYIFISAQGFKQHVNISAAELREWYDKHLSDFATPQMVDVAYIMISPEELADIKNIPESAAREWYEANKGKFERPERIHARHILVPLVPDADDAAKRAAEAKIEDARKQLGAGKSFASVADAFNASDAAAKGGDLGWIRKGETVPEFEAAAFGLSVGKVSDPVRTPFGLHLVLVEEKQEAGIAPFKDVAEEALKAVAFDEGSEKLHEVLDNLIEDNILQKPLAEAAARYGLKASQTGLQDKNGLMQSLHLSGDGADSLLAVPAGAPLDTALESGNNYIIARVVKSEPAGTKSFDAVKSEIQNIVVEEKALELAMAESEKLLKRIKGEKPDQIKNNAFGIKTSEPLERGGTVPGFEMDDKLMQAIFEAKPETWLATPFAVTGKKDNRGALLAYIDKLVPPAPGEYESVAEILARGGKQERLEGLFGIFVQQIAQKAKVEVPNPDLIDRVDM